MKSNLLILFLFSLLSAYGQTTADQVMSRTAAQLQDAPMISAKFSAVAGDQKAAGEMSMSQARFKMSSGDYSVWYDGANMWSYYKSSGETYLSLPTAEDLLETNPFVIFNNYKNHYTAKLLESKDGHYKVQLLPYSKQGQISKIVLTIEKSNWLPSSVIVTFSNNSIVRVNLTNVTIGNAIPKANAYRYPAADYPNVELIDLR